jgi:hypothetical protein
MIRTDRSELGLFVKYCTVDGWHEWGCIFIMMEERENQKIMLFSHFLYLANQSITNNGWSSEKEFQTWIRKPRTTTRRIQIWKRTTVLVVVEWKNGPLKVHSYFGWKLPSRRDWKLPFTNFCIGWMPGEARRLNGHTIYCSKTIIEKERDRYRYYNNHYHATQSSCRRLPIEFT